MKQTTAHQGPRHVTHTQVIESAPSPDILPIEVTQAYLPQYDEDQLEGRLTHYEREALFERDTDTRAALKIEVERTESELRRRRMYRRAEADRVFKL